ncbi:MAG: hypothetical protein J5750_09280 [Clostridiales bacterium]|nr:hypothetical protein [Clostridiales bacterium]
MKTKSLIANAITVTKAQKDLSITLSQKYGISPLNILGVLAVTDLLTRSGIASRPEYRRSRFEANGTSYVVRVTTRNGDELRPDYGNVLPTTSSVSPFENILFLSYNPGNDRITIAGVIRAIRFFDVAISYDAHMPPMNNKGHKIDLYGKNIRECRMDQLEAFAPALISSGNKKNSKSRSNSSRNTSKNTDSPSDADS